RSDAEDHPEHRQERAQLVPQEVLQPQAEHLRDALDPHQAPLSFRTAPSRISTTRGSRAAISGLCVTMSTVRPWRFNSTRSASTSSPLFVSRFPVGSSARIIAGSFASA